MDLVQLLGLVIKQVLSQVGDITFYHSDGSSQGGGASWHFVSEPDTVLVVGSSSVNGRFVAKSAGVLVKLIMVFMMM